MLQPVIRPFAEPSSVEPGAEPSGRAWRACLRVAAARRSGAAAALAMPSAAELAGWRDDERDLLELYRPVLVADATQARVFGHLGQSIDGMIAVAGGDSRYVTGHPNLVHLHRMRALCDAVLVGASTVDLDDPQLTTRLVEGEHPQRVVLDPLLRVPPQRRVFRDASAPTLIVCDRSRAPEAAARIGGERVVPVPTRDGRVDPCVVVAALAERGVRSLFVEGGGLTVSRFIEAGALDRLQVAVAPLLVGAGRSGLSLPGAALMRDCRRPTFRVWTMGADVLWDFDLRDCTPVPAATPAAASPRRVI